MNAQNLSALIITVVAAIAALATVPKSRYRRPLVVACAMLMVVAIGLFVVGGLEGAEDGTPSADTEQTSEPDPLPRTSSSGERTSSSSTTETEDERSGSLHPVGTTTYYLTELDYVEVEIEGRGGGCTGGCTGFQKESAKIGATTYPQSFITRLDGDGDRSISSWNSLRSCERFDATVGLTNESGSTDATFTISKDGGPPEVLAVVTTGDAAPVFADLNGVNRFTIAAYVTGAEPERAIAVWGDAALTCVAGSLA